MPVDSSSPDNSGLLIQTYFCFQSLVHTAGASKLPELGLGGRLLYAGELDSDGRAIVLAGNIAGCATLAATADMTAQKMAIRDGVVDFLVTSLDEALRILKNEIRKKATVAVCIAAAPEVIEREMLERGVSPDLTRDNAARERESIPVTEPVDAASDPASAPAVISWQVDSSPARWLPKIDTVALECLDAADELNHRWLRRLPLYLGRLAPNTRLVRADREFAAKFVERLRAHYDRGDIQAPATVLAGPTGIADEHHFAPSPQSTGR